MFSSTCFKRMRRGRQTVNRQSDRQTNREVEIQKNRESEGERERVIMQDSDN